MSAIFGVIRRPGEVVEDAELELMAGALRHRGPDGVHFSARHNAGLGHAMLHSTPESLGESLPYCSKTVGLTITADARIDNREQLLSMLAMPPAANQATPDSLLILEAFIKWGENCVDHLLGDFTFAIWNEQMQSLFIARDHMGCKPFYYHCSSGLFVFGSSARAVACIAQVKASLNEGRVADYLVQELEGINKTCSWYNEINRLPPAHIGHYRNDGLERRPYWELKPDDLSHLKTDEDFLEAFSEVYGEAVRARLRCHTRPASMVSGGLDSSTAAALARDILADKGEPPLRVFSAISEFGESCPETDCIEAIISQAGVEARRLRSSEVSAYTQELSAIMEATEDPFDGGWIMLEMMFLLVSRSGGRMLLSGVEGESAMGAPTDYIKYFLRERRWRSAWSECQGFSRHYYRGELSALQLFARALRSHLAPRSIRAARREFANWAYSKRRIRQSIISSRFARQVNLAARLRELEGNTRQASTDMSLPVWQQHDLVSAYNTCGIERYERLASYAGVEVRHPLLDIRLLAFSNGLPLHQKVRGGWSKFMLRSLADQRLSASVAWREGWEELGWAFTDEHARSVLGKSELTQEQMTKALAKWVDAKELQQCFAAGQSGDAEQLGDLWDHYQLYLWLRKSGLGGQ